MPFPHWSIMSAFSLYSWSAAGEAAALVRNHCINVHRSFFFVIWEREEKTLQNTEPLKKKKKKLTILSWWITLTQLNKNTLAIPKSRAHFIFICSVTLLMVSVTKAKQNKSVKQTKSQVSGMQSFARWIGKVGQWVINANLMAKKPWPAEKEEV